MQNVITQKQALTITGGREPMTIPEIQKAIELLREVRTLDEAKYFSDKMSALAAWAKMYHKREHEIEAKRGTLHAYRRMGILAGELRPRNKAIHSEKRGPNSILGGAPGSLKLLQDAGLKRGQAQAARAISKIPSDTFDAAINNPKPVSPSVLGLVNLSEWAKISGALSHAARLMREIDADIAAKQIKGKRIDLARRLVMEILIWLRAFDSSLSEVKRR